MSNNAQRNSLAWNKHFIKENVPKLSKMIHMNLRPLFSIIKSGKFKGCLKSVPSKVAERKRCKYIKSDKDKKKFSKLLGLHFKWSVYDCGIFFPHMPKNLYGSRFVTVPNYNGVHVYSIRKYIKHCNQVESAYNKKHHTHI